MTYPLACSLADLPTIDKRQEEVMYVCPNTGYTLPTGLYDTVWCDPLTPDQRQAVEAARADCIIRKRRNGLL